MNKIKSLIKANTIILKIVVIHDLCNVVVSLIFYKLIPLILNYPQSTYDTKFQWELENTKYSQQYLMITLLTIIFLNIWLCYSLRCLYNFDNTIYSKDLSEIEAIRVKCIQFPVVAYIVQSLLPSAFIISIITVSTKNITTVTFKLWIMFFSLGTLIATFSYIFTKKLYVRILLKTNFHEYKNNSKLSLKVKIIIQLIPIFIVALLFISLIGYSRLIKEKGEIIFRLYDYEITQVLERLDIKTKDDMVRLLDEIALVNQGDEVFIIPPSEGQILKSRELPQLSEFFIKHMNEIALSADGHVFDYYGVDAQGIAKQILLDNQIWVIGVRYLVGSDETLTFFAISFAALFAINFIVILYFAKTLTDDISRVTQNLEEIASGVDQTFEKRLVITSNDEIGDLVIAFNKIQSLEKRSIEAIKEQQAILIEQERLASLGQLIGGIAHNLKTPIMSISGGIEALKDLAYEYRDSIGDRSVNDQDHKEIAKEMLMWLEKMKPYCAYMSDVISAVKGQAVQMISTNTVKFTVDEVVKRVELLLKHELKKYHCVLNVNSHVDVSTELKGEINNLVQVFDNIIINAMQAYDGENGTIDLEIVRSGDNVEFTIKDYGKGIPKNVADRLFKEMITTKGKNGTGLGLYMSYATIRGRFGGNMSFVTKEGCGTTFFISIPCVAYGNQEEDK